MRNFKICLIAVFAAFTAACGGGGSGDSSSSNGKAFYAVTGVKNGGPYIVCIDASYEDPQSANGKAVSQSIVNYYGLTGSYTVLSGTGDSCRDKYPLANTVISTTFYNSTVSGTPAPVAAGPTATGTTGSGVGAGTSPATNSDGKVYVDRIDNCAQVENTRIESIAQWYKVTNTCNVTIKFYSDNNFTSVYGSLKIMPPGQSDTSWYSREKGSSLNYYVCPANGPTNEDVYTDSARLNCYYRPR